MRYWLGLALGLALISGRPAIAEERLRIDVPPPLTVEPITASTTQPVSLTKIVIDMPIGEPWAEGGYSQFGCRGRHDDWKASYNDLRPMELGRVFGGTLTSLGLKVAGDRTNLFDDDDKTADLQVGALITTVRGRECEPNFGNGYTGAITMDVEWQVFSVSRGKVVARIPVHAGFEQKKPEVDVLQKLFIKAFADSTRRLVADPGFRKLIEEDTNPMGSGQPMPRITFSAAPTAKPTSLTVAARSVVTVFAGASFGSGVVVSNDGYILTNDHVAGASGRVRLRWPDGSETVGEVIRTDPRRDVTLIKAPTKAPPLAIRHSPLELGETVFVIGTPREKEFAGTVTRGVVSSVDRKINGRRFIQSDVAMTHGNSGGPLLDGNGWVIGLSDLTYEPGGVSQNINFFIPIDEALNALALTPRTSGDNTDEQARHVDHRRHSR